MDICRVGIHSPLCFGDSATALGGKPMTAPLLKAGLRSSPRCFRLGNQAANEFSIKHRGAKNFTVLCSLPFEVPSSGGQSEADHLCASATSHLLATSRNCSLASCHLLRTRQQAHSSRRHAASTGFLPRATSAGATSAVQVGSEPAVTTGQGNTVSGKTIIVTGANTGMGIVIAQELALQGAHTIMACRSEERGTAALERVNSALQRSAQGSRGSSGGEMGIGSASLELLDLASLASVRKFAERVKGSHSHVDQLVCNAGIMIPPHSFTEDGFESQFQVNHLGHYLLTRLLLPSMLSSPSRPSIVHISSLAGENVNISEGEFWQIARRGPEDYSPFLAYRQSKLAQVLFTVETNRRLGEQVTVNAVHPGIVNTELFNRNMSSTVISLLAPLGKFLEFTGLLYTAEKGASTALYLATNPATVTSTGGYWADSAPRPANPVAYDPALGKEWWERSAEAAGIDP